MKKWVLAACALAMATSIGVARAEQGDDGKGKSKGKDFLAQGVPQGDYKLERKGPPFPPPGPPPCAPPSDRDEDCHHPASR